VLGRLSVAHGAQFIVWHANVDWIVAESRSGTAASTAHFLQWAGGTVGDVCDDSRRIDGGRTISFYVVDDAEPKLLNGHNGNFTCKVFSLWIPRGPRGNRLSSLGFEPCDDE